jgi:carboxyl-terminal processing protease
MRVLSFFLLLFSALFSSFAQDQFVEQFNCFWGCLKYNDVNKKHTETDWDRIYLNIYPDVILVRSQDEFNQVLESFVECFDKKKWKKSNPEHFENVETINYLSLISPKLKCYLYAVQNESFGYREQLPAKQSFCNSSIYFPCFKNEKSYPIDSCSIEKYRSLSLAKFWNVIEYFYPYKKELKLEWSKVLNKYIPLFRKPHTETSYLSLCRELNTEIYDAHAATSLQGAFTKLNKLSVPFSVLFKDRMKVSHSLDSLVKIDDVILKINDLTPNELFHQKESFYKVLNGACRQDIINKMLLSNSVNTNLTILRDGNDTLNVTVTNVEPRDVFFLDKCSRDSEITDTTLYINLACYSSTDAFKLLEDCQGGKKLILDLREYPKVSIDFLSHFTSVKVKYGDHVIPKKNHPGTFKVWKPAVIIPQSPNFALKFTKIEVLINKETISKGEYIAMGLSCLDNVFLVGSNTSGTLGSIGYFELPGGYVAVFTMTGFTPLDGVSIFGKGIQPDSH